MKQVLVVTIITSLEAGVEPIVTVFSNREAAMKCFKYYISLDYKCCIDACDIYDHFISYEKEVEA